MTSALEKLAGEQAENLAKVDGLLDSIRELDAAIAKLEAQPWPTTHYEEPCPQCGGTGRLQSSQKGTRQ